MTAAVAELMFVVVVVVAAVFVVAVDWSKTLVEFEMVVEIVAAVVVVVGLVAVAVAAAAVVVAVDAVVPVGLEETAVFVAAAERPLVVAVFVE